MSYNIDDIKRRYHIMSGMHDRQSSELEELASAIDQDRKELEVIDKASVVIRELANTARLEFSSEVDTLVSLAVRSVFTENFRFALSMSTDSGRLQCAPIIIETIDGVESEYTPKDDMGGSVLDSIGAALRIVLHKFQRSKSRPVFLLDEPFKYTGHSELSIRAGEMLKELSDSLGLQFIIITHEPELEAIGDVVYTVRRQSGISAIIAQDTLNAG